ncbi:hypothetical protein DESPIG_00324 [Desulfovibrio piger ATCC 29098]|uniref:Uncharacterized protein n=1 Tax=Desulfovibrio piger ATCC 29098 TaxID=411464 RepID=B6WQK0_9BACT|nr:hypothetical protein DESPIG_00324 [Desulfovibrio piger ATCC 29098]
MGKASQGPIAQTPAARRVFSFTGTAYAALVQGHMLFRVSRPLPIPPDRHLPGACLLRSKHSPQGSIA